MNNFIHCWIAEQILPLTDGTIAPEAAEWLTAHGRVCLRHRVTSKPPPAFGPDARMQADALARISAAWPREKEQARAFASWLGELTAEWRAAPMPMAAISVASILIGILQRREFLP